MRLEKTDKGRAELQTASRQLGRRERNLLILADGQRTIDQLDQLMGGQARDLAQRLIEDGYLLGIELKPSPRRAPEPEKPREVAADPFDGKRSLATTRMFLFDICERLFVRRSPELAEQFRQSLREARDRDSMLAAAREMLVAVEAVAGAERADAISERIAMLLPPEPETTMHGAVSL
jgi:hypothetical protein